MTLPSEAPSTTTKTATFSPAELLTQYQTVNQQIITACQQSKRNTDAVLLIAVSKTKPAEMIAVLAKAGQQHFGENYLQEAIAKINQLADDLPASALNQPLVWHYIGHIQRNKTRDIAEHFDWVHTVERDLIAKRLNEQRPSNLPALNILIQVNIDNEENKSGCQPNDVTKLVEQIMTYPHLNLRGLMVIPAKNEEDSFARTQALFQKIKSAYPQLKNWDTLSMGMSSDMEKAIDCGATMVRVGAAIFGKRASFN